MKLKHVDNYTWGLSLIILGLVLIVKNENRFLGGVTGILGFGLMLYIGYKGTGEIVENEFNGKLAIKREESKEPEIFYNKSLVEKIDGAATAFDRYRVFKVSNGIKVKVLPSGELKETTWLATLMNTGYTAKLRTDENWKPLYEVATKL